MNIAIVGATGNVGRKMLEVLEQEKIPVDQLYLVASSKSVGQKIIFNNKEYEVCDLKDYDFSKAEITFFAAGGKISEKYAEKASKHTTVIDNSSFFRMDKDVPLIVPQVNPDAIKKLKKNIIANPNCSTSQLVIVLKPLHDEFKIKRIVISTYQSVSGGGKAQMNELIDQTQIYLENQLNQKNKLDKIKSKNFTKQIAFNAIPQIDIFADDGYTKEELKMVNETKKILDQKIELTATCVRVPVLVSHAESVNIEFEEPFSLEKIYSLIDSAEGCELYDKREDGGYITPLEAEGHNETYVSRIRKDRTKKNSINIWIVSDNLLRGAALNAVEIAKLLIKKKYG